MATTDTSCSINPYFQVQEGQLDAFKALCERFVAASHTEEKCQYYGFAFDGNLAYCREAYADAEGLLAHLDNVGALLEEAFKISEITRLEICGPEAELAKLREPLSGLNPQFFALECGFKK